MKNISEIVTELKTIITKLGPKKVIVIKPLDKGIKDTVVTMLNQPGINIVKKENNLFNIKHIENGYGTIVCEYIINKPACKHTVILNGEIVGEIINPTMRYYVSEMSNFDAIYNAIRMKSAQNNRQRRM